MRLIQRGFQGERDFRKAGHEAEGQAGPSRVGGEQNESQMKRALTAAEKRQASGGVHVTSAVLQKRRTRV